jgi:hypothetical protein
MILTLVAAAATAVVAATTGYLIARRRGGSGDARRALPKRGGGGRAAPPSDPKKDAKGAPEAEALTGLPLTLGDVIVAGTEERWLAGALVAREKGRVVSALFLAPEGATTRAVVAFALPKTEIFWLDPTDVVSPAEPPATLELAGAMLTRRSRLPVVVERLGQGAPRVGDAVLWATYEGGGREVAVVLVSEGRALAWMGRRLDADEYDRLGSGGS